jgi:hypothetical protein
MALPRRKSCAACVAGKRRCDLALPACRRCISKGVACIYPWAARHNAHSSLDCIRSTASEPQLSKSSYDADSTAYQPDNLDSAPLWDGLGTNAYASPVDANLPWDSLAAPGTATALLRPLSPPAPFSLADIITRGAISSPLDFAISISTTVGPQHHDIQVPHTSHDDAPANGSLIIQGKAYQPRAEFIGRRLAAQPHALAERGMASFIHHTQVNSSVAVQEALAASALHSIRNAGNVSMVRREIARRAAVLIRAVSLLLATEDTAQSVEIDLLPAVQAMLIYQCIRLFASDGDLAQLAQAQRDEETLLSWARRLQKQPASRPLDAAGLGKEGDWKFWIREESIRRSVVAAEVLASIHKFLRYGWEGGHRRLAPLAFTAQAALWEAGSAAEWRTNFVKLRGLPVKLGSFTGDIAGAAEGDVEELSVIVYAMHNGVQGLEEWLGGDKALLKKWALRP